MRKKIWRENVQRRKRKNEPDFWDSVADLVDNLVNETKNYLDRVMAELKKLLSQDEPEIDIEGRMEAEAYNYRMETAERGQRQAQYANYRRISQMTSDVQTLLGNIRA